MDRKMRVDDEQAKRECGDDMYEWSHNQSEMETTGSNNQWGKRDEIDENRNMEHQTKPPVTYGRLIVGSFGSVERGETRALKCLRPARFC